MQVPSFPRRRRRAARWPQAAILVLACLAAGPGAAKKPATLTADPATKLLLKPAEVIQVVVSPNGGKLAIARKTDKTIEVTVNSFPGMKVLRTIKPGNVGDIRAVRWLDDARLVIGTDAAVAVDRTAITIAMPSMFIVPVAGGRATQMPMNFVATIEGDPDHLLVSNCTRMVDGDCVMEVRKVGTAPGAGTGELVVEAPDSHSVLLTDDLGHVRFAVGWSKDGRSRTWVNDGVGKAWTLINDESQTGLSVYPMGVAADGKSGFLQSQRAEGTDAVEHYDFATGRRTEVLRAPGSDPLGLILATTTREPIGAWFDKTHPQPRFWTPGHPQAVLLAEAQSRFPGATFVLTSISSDNQRAVLFVGDDRDAGSFHLYDRATGKATLLARARPWLAADKMAPAREISLPARDGLPLKGILTTPVHAGGSPLPMVVLVHGGPYEIADGWGFDDEVQILAQQGFAVLQVNFRGSGGYGKAFVDKGMRQWGKAMQDDVTDATRWAIAQGIADPARLCIYGASYGAYAALMGAAREPDLYRCAAGYAGVYDLKKLYKWDNLRRTDLGKDFLRRAIGSDEADMAQSSPMLQAQRIKAAVFLAHGEMDERSDIRFARAMQKALNKTRKDKVELVTYPWQGHGLVDPAQREDFFARLLAFLHANLDATKQTGAAVASSP
jgi:dipeptidyl aminopeptidase/acylaminoacyl peptidase